MKIYFLSPADLYRNRLKCAYKNVIIRPCKGDSPTPTLIYLVHSQVSQDKKSAWECASRTYEEMEQKFQEHIPLAIETREKKKKKKRKECERM